jgi:exosome complex component RRP40
LGGRRWSTKNFIHTAVKLLSTDGVIIRYQSCAATPSLQNSSSNTQLTHTHGALGHRRPPRRHNPSERSAYGHRQEKDAHARPWPASHPSAYRHYHSGRHARHRQQEECRSGRIQQRAGQFCFFSHGKRTRLTLLQYTPFAGDLVIATVNGSAAENFNCLLTPNTPPATLPHLAFEGATKKTRPQLPPNSLVYCRVASAGKDYPAELTCVDPSTGKSEGLGPLKGGMLFKITVGRNGLLHVDGGNVKTTLGVGKGIQDVDKDALDEDAQRKLAADILKTL